MKLGRERILYDSYNFNGEGYEESDFLWEDTMYELKTYFNNSSVIAFGSVGLWNGVFDCAKLFDDIESAVYHCIEDCDYVKIYDINGHLYITCSHHDGRCQFELKKVTASGDDYYDRWNYGCDNRREYKVLEQIAKRYSVLPRYAEKVRGCKARQYEEATKEAYIRQLNNKAKSFYS